MIVVEESRSLRLVTQSDHARLAHDILALWKDAAVASNPLREDLLFATAEHDGGWRGADSAPQLNPDNGRPRDFRDYPDRDRRLLWAEYVAGLDDARPRAGLLIIRHAERIHGDRSALPEWREFFSDLAERRSLLEESCDASPTDLDEAYEYLALADSVSLGACGAFGARSLAWRGYALVMDSGRLAMRPFPYAGPLTLRVACRLLDKRQFSTAEDLAVSLTAARWQFMPIRIEAG